MNEPKPKLGKTETGEDLHYTAGAIIRNEMGQILIIERATFPPGFASPAGHIDEGETPEQALVREVKEETGLDVIRYELIREGLADLTPRPCSRSVYHHYWYLYTCDVNGKVSQNLEETKSISWYSPEQIKELVLEPVWEYWFKEVGII